MHLNSNGVVGQARDRTVDAWRGLSVLIVILCHVVTERYESRFDGTQSQANGLPLHGLFAVAYRLKPAIYSLSTGAGTLAVQFFLVISGYIITTLLAREHQRAGRISLSAFYVRRAFRILPPAGLVLGFTFLMSFLGYIAVTPKSFWLASTFLCNTSSECGWFLGHLWSLAVEEQFYLVWPCMLLVVGFRAVPQLAAGLMTVFLLLSQLRLLDVGRVDNGMCFACIAAGCLYATSSKFRSIIARGASVPVVALACALLFCRPVIPTLFLGSQRILDVLTPALICFVIFSCFQHRDRLERLVVVQALSRLGLVSYGLYLWQQLFLAAPEKYLRPSILEYTPACLLICVLSYFLFEKPLIRLGARLSQALINRGLTTTATGVDPLTGTEKSASEPKLA
jgi:peptidoglycan/LPS O-acetylase OafA/YrhL